MTSSRRKKIRSDSHTGLFRLWPVDDPIRPWRFDDGTAHGWKAKAAWVDVEPDITISVGRRGSNAWLQGDAEVLVDAQCCCPDGYATACRPYGNDAPHGTAEWKARNFTSDTQNCAAHWLLQVAPAAKAADLAYVRGLARGDGVVMLARSDRGREWIHGKSKPCGNFGWAFAHLADPATASRLRRRARRAGLRVMEADVARLHAGVPESRERRKEGSPWN